MITLCTIRMLLEGTEGTLAITIYVYIYICMIIYTNI
jgi:hypothetical protein